MKLGEFLKLYQDEFVPNWWKIMVSEKLSFEQDLIYSRLVSAKTLQKFYTTTQEFDGEFEELSTLNRSMILLKNEIINGVITHDMIEVLRKI